MTLKSTKSSKASKPPLKANLPETGGLKRSSASGRPPSTRNTRRSFTQHHLCIAVSISTSGVAMASGRGPTLQPQSSWAQARLLGGSQELGRGDVEEDSEAERPRRLRGLFGVHVAVLVAEATFRALPNNPSGCGADCRRRASLTTAPPLIFAQASANAVDEDALESCGAPAVAHTASERVRFGSRATNTCPEPSPTWLRKLRSSEKNSSLSVSDARRMSSAFLYEASPLSPGWCVLKQSQQNVTSPQKRSKSTKPSSSSYWPSDNNSVMVLKSRGGDATC
mmetsp:Transcript_42818/g.118321  ORF Transcript_42818/g.118321 Transcript_42818/m.118321 type:complete len:281 (-) Transcript_42818:708-1550(-)